MSDYESFATALVEVKLKSVPKYEKSSELNTFRTMEVSKLTKSLKADLKELALDFIRCKKSNFSMNRKLCIINEECLAKFIYAVNQPL